MAPGRLAMITVDQVTRLYAVRGQYGGWDALAIRRAYGTLLEGQAISEKAAATLDVTRLVTDGTKNACSILYAAAARVAREMGFDEIQTYILESEPGTSLRAAGWNLDGVTGGGDWERTSGSRKGQLSLDGRMQRSDQPMTPKQRWVKVLR